ncbi:MAG: rod shape-determining protein MreC [Chitinophagaceae bacterium]|jgi:rod shape-determining protein MreC|nr:rod shape-determining protein MreC [Bacteroidota bacterium]MBL0279854.1 rod shape-determining protein MreC [Bacteroidota bacterium]
MRSFFLFIIRHYAVFLFGLLELISLYFVFTYNNFHNTFFINSANGVSGNVLNTYGNFQEYFSLKEVNDSLMHENALLREQLLLSAIPDSSSVLVKDSLGQPLYSYIPAEVIGNSFTEPNNYITLNKGSNDGIRENMGVITSSGIVGRVVKVSPKFSVVMSVLHSQFVSRVAVQKNNSQGRLTWEGKSPTHISVIQVSEPGTLNKGDSVVTTKISPMFPPDIMVGTVESFGKDPGSNYYTLNVRLSTKFSSLQFVYVVNELLQKERTDLENSATDAGN